MLVLRTSRPKPPKGIGAALALGPRSAAAAGAPCGQASPFLLGWTERNLKQEDCAVARNQTLVERFQIVNRLCEDVQSTRYVV